MKLKAIIRFRDIEASVIREVNEVFEVSEKRGKVLVKLGFVEEVKEPKRKK